MVTLSNENFKSEILSATEAIVVFAQLSSNLAVKTLDFLETLPIKSGFVDFESERELVQKFNILSLPTVLYFKNGRVRNKSNRVENANEYAQLIEK